MNIVTKTIKTINPAQTPVDVCDQPVYALTKQWRFPARFGNNSYFSLFVELHVEKSLLAVHGECIKGSGLPELLGQSNLSLTGIEKTTVDVNHIKRARYGLQVSACAIYEKLKEAHRMSGSDSPIWRCLQERTEIHVMTLDTYSYIHQVHQGIQLSTTCSSSEEPNETVMFVSTSLGSCVPSIYLYIYLQQLFEKIFYISKNQIRIFQTWHSTKYTDRITNTSKVLVVIRWELCGAELAKIISDFENLPKGRGYFSYNQDTLRRQDLFKSRFSNGLKQVNVRFSSNRFNLPNLAAISNTNVTFSEEL